METQKLKDAKNQIRNIQHCAKQLYAIYTKDAPNWEKTTYLNAIEYTITEMRELINEEHAQLFQSDQE